MKFSIMKKGQTCLLVSLCVLASACNPDEFFPIEEFLTGEDAYCYEAKDLNSCQARADRCQPAYVESDDETKPLEFVLCLANPDPEAVDDGSTTGGSDGSTTGGSDGSTTGGSDGSTTGGSDGSTTGGSDDGSTTGGTDGSSTGGSDPVVVAPVEIPSLEDAIASKCQNLSSEYIWEKIEKKKGKVVNKVSKVKVCHMTSSGSAHTIVIACPALKAHTKHHQEEDYLGACF